MNRATILAYALEVIVFAIPPVTAGGITSLTLAIPFRTRTDLAR
jgi:hypothetical protein